MSRRCGTICSTEIPTFPTDEANSRVREVKLLSEFFSCHLLLSEAEGFYFFFPFNF